MDHLFVTCTFPITIWSEVNSSNYGRTRWGKSTLIDYILNRITDKVVATYHALP
jgi:hypothetical protein